MIAAAAMLAVGQSCDDSGRMTAESLRAAATSITVDGDRWTLQVEAWRSFQPIVGADGDPLIVVSRLTGSRPISADVVGRRLHLILEAGEPWSGPASEEQTRDAQATTVEFVTRNGPNWSPGTAMDAILEFTTRSGEVQFIRAPRTTVLRVD
ncbi:MAG: hypothetical protein ACT4OZ_08300 [Gemmatimonadota bacterium]